MPHTQRDNFKAKWEAALATKRAELTAGRDSDAVATGARDTVFGTSAELRKLQHAVLEAASAGRQVLHVMEDFSDTGALKFGVHTSDVDGKLTDMNLIVIARRLRDIFKIAEARIGVLSIALNESHMNLMKVKENLSIIKTSNTQMQAMAMETLYIGARPRSTEIDDWFKDPTTARFGARYEDLDENWIDTELIKSKHSSKITYANHDESSDDNDEQDEEDDYNDDNHTSNALVAQSNEVQALSHNRNQFGSANDVPL
uniref:Uncharacterized protein n=1 Tax=Grapevine-associated negative single-stranded RNA virus 1 TaxID=2814398 RepID=A0A8F5MKN6_9VIRU|nr:MAG: hypothetical protein [Grapevine-associated negative single-stranded RNA virus 1]